MMTVTATVTRVGEWWAIDVRDVTDITIHTQVRSLSDVSEMVADAVSLVAGVDVTNVVVETNVVLAPSVRSRIRNVAKLRARADEAQAKATAEARAVAQELQRAGLNLRDIGDVLAVSQLQVQRLVTD